VSVPFRVILERGNSRLQIEGDSEFIESRLKDLLPVFEQGSLKVPTTGQDESASEAVSSEAATAGHEPQSLRRFFEAKRPGNLYERSRVCCTSTTSSVGETRSPSLNSEVN